MALSTGMRHGSYEILSAIGAGGMGEVYRARDTSLKRDVALKILPESFATDAERLARFQREAEVLASLNHPNIAAIYGFEHDNGVKALVMELVEGEDLAERVARRPIPLDEALPIARQIADALEAAHEQGIIHRDLKPANIKVRADGTVKVLDFGLAKAVPRATAHVEESATISAAPVTISGMILGTAAYMAPEQAKGNPADRRVDIWALGCVMFEMLTGRRAFAGRVPDVLVSIIEHEPDWQALPARTPPAIHRLLHRCLEKDFKRRLDSAAVARIEIEEAARERTSGVEPAGTRRRSHWRPIAWAATGAGVAVLVTMLLGSGARPKELSVPLVASSVAIDSMPQAPGVHFAVAPSGRTVVFAANYGARTVLYRRDLDRVDPQPIVGTEGGSDVFFSQDGRSLGFETRSELWAVSLDGGTPQMLLPNQPLRGGTWGEGDRIILGRVGSGLWMASAKGGEPRQLTVPEQGERHELPQILPGGRAILFTILASDKPARVAVHLLATGETRSLFEGVGARFVDSGHVMFGRQGRLWAVRFDPDSLLTLGTALPVRDDVLWSATGYPQFTVDAGLLAYVRASQASSKVEHLALTWVDRRGKNVVPLKIDNPSLSRLSPAGDRLVYQVGASWDLWAHDLTRGTSNRLTSDRIIAFSAPTWTPDGSRVIFTTWFDGEVGLGWLPADGSGRVEELIKGVGMRSFERTHPVMLPDGSGVILTGLAPGKTVEDLLLVRLTGERRLETLFEAAGVERNPAIAPSGRFVAYNSDESRRAEVYVRPYPNASSRKWQISTEGGSGPVWTRNGSEIVYKDSRGRMMAVAVRSHGNSEIDYSKPELLFETGNNDDAGLDRGWNVAPDGNRFLIAVRGRGGEGRDTALELILIQNWTDELKRLVPISTK